MKNTGLKIPEKDQLYVLLGFSYYWRAKIIGKSFSILSLYECYTRVKAFKNLEETMHVQVGHFFPKFKFPNSGCGLSASAAYTPVFTVLLTFSHGTNQF